MRHTFFLLLCLIVSSSFFAQSTSQSISEHEELGQVAWYRNDEQALSQAKQTNKAVLLLFQEVPGCATCRNYGHNVLSHPLMVEAIEELFIPLAIFNNKKGADRKVLNRYQEPSWNNPVVRIVDQAGKDLIPRIAGDYSATTLLAQMKWVCTLRDQKIPAYVHLLEAELQQQSGDIVEKDYQMYCFWSGEKALGQIDGVLSTQSGFKGGSEVVKVKFDRRIISEEQVDQLARKNKCTPKSNGQFQLSETDLHYYLQHSHFIYIPLTEIQKTKINSALGQKKNTTKYLSPQQAQWIEEIKYGKRAKRRVFEMDFRQAWAQMDVGKE